VALGRWEENKFNTAQGPSLHRYQELAIAIREWHCPGCRTFLKGLLLSKYLEGNKINLAFALLCLFSLQRACIPAR
jgi:hypothetical protein